jgi:UDP:flavonoid glycosyltransferase YjiC (YdhE family)
VSASGLENLSFWAKTVNRDITVPFVTELCELVRTKRPDLLVAELAASTWAQAVHELEGIPFAATAWAAEPGYLPFRHEESGFNRARAELGLAPLELIEPALWITFTPPRWGELDGPPLEETRRYRLPVDPSGLAVPGASGRPFVYATLGTVWNTTRRLLRAFIAAIDDGGWSGLVTVGRTNDPARFERPGRVAVEQYVPQADVLALADVMVCHGGLGSMLGAMGAGCPMVVVPLGADQLDNASKAQRLGIARVVDPADATPETLRAAIVEVLESRTQQDSCHRLQQEVATMPTLHELTAELQRLVP